MTSVVTAGGASVTMRGGVVDEAGPVLDRLVSDGVPGRLARGAATLWGPDAAAAGALGWLDLPARSRVMLGRLAELAGEARAGGLDRVVLAGAGDAAGAAEAITRTAGADLEVLDTPDPRRVRAVLDDGRLPRTLVVLTDHRVDGREPSAATDAHHRIFERAFRDAGYDGDDLRRRFLAVAVPGSPLARLADGAGYPLVPDDADAPGGFGALGAAALVPCALAGADVARVLDEAAALVPSLRQPYDNPALALGAALAAAARSGRGTLAIADQDSGLAGLADWAADLVAAATGKDGRGLLPVVVEGVDAPGFQATGDMRRVLLGRRPDEHAPGREAALGVAGPLGAQFLLWQYAVAVAGRVLGIDPFARPDIGETDDNAAALLRSEEGGSPTVIARPPALVSGAVEVHAPDDLLKGADELGGALDAVLRAVPGGGYLAVTAFLDRWGDPDAGGLRSLLAERGARVRRHPVPVTFGWAPRALRSSGQYHKAGAADGIVVQVTGAVDGDVEVPGRPYTLGQLQLAQAFGDQRVLRSRGRPVVRLHLRDRADGLARLTKALTG